MPDSEGLDEKIRLCEKIINYEFKDKFPCIEALHTFNTSVMYMNELRSVRKNDSLAVLGDAVLAHHLCRQWYTTGNSRGQWSMVQREVAGNENLACAAVYNGLNECLVVVETVDFLSERMLATLMEAIIGAVSLDCGDDPATMEALFFRLRLDHDLLISKSPAVPV
ncbi:ribonuclease III domain-containing protein [Exophiala viscosa]|uniref:ribonuclease III domain-containing protein n=1 Tax=Exophiala viscosa TaxID=2486360 RepID=UPI002190E964|nr:ribonuclease III domain-containing protein [Exophiala viscosa]